MAETYTAERVRTAEDVTAGRPPRWRWSMVADNGLTGLAGYCAKIGTCTGHTTSAEARDHHREYMLDRELDLDGVGELGRCVVGGEATDRYAEMYPMGPRWILCDLHRTRAQCATLFGEPPTTVTRG